NNTDSNTGKRLPNRSSPGANLAKAGSAEIPAIHSHHRRALSAAITFQRPDSKSVLKGQRQALRQLLCPHQYVLQAAKMFRQAAAHVCLKECRSSDQECDAVAPYQFADGAGIQRVGMKYHADAMHRRQPQRSHESEGMKKR